MSIWNISFSRRSIILILLGISLFTKLIFINRPVTDWQSSTQAATLSKATYIYQGGVKFLLNPRTQVFKSDSTLSNQSSDEFPIIAGLIAIAWNLSPYSDQIARLVCLLFSLVGTFYFILLSERFFSNIHFSAFVTIWYIFSPMQWFFHQSITNDVIAVNFLNASVYHFFKWKEFGRKFDFSGAVFFTTVAILSKSYALLILFVFIAEEIKTKGALGTISNFYNLVLVIFCALPAFLGKYIFNSHVTFNTTNIEQGLTQSAFSFSFLKILLDPDHWINFVDSFFNLTIMPIGCLLLLPSISWFKKLNEFKTTIFWLLAALLAYLFFAESGEGFSQMSFLPPTILISAFVMREFWNSQLKKTYVWRKKNILVFSVLALLGVNGLVYTVIKARWDDSSVKLGKKVLELRKQQRKFYIVVVEPDDTLKYQTLYYARSEGWHNRFFPDEDQMDLYKAKNAQFLAINVSENQEQEYSKELKLIKSKYRLLWSGNALNRFNEEKKLYLFDI